MYDVCWLRSYGIKLNGFIMDTMVMASLIDENRFRYDLNSISFDYTGERVKPLYMKQQKTGE